LTAKRQDFGQCLTVDSQKHREEGEEGTTMQDILDGMTLLLFHTQYILPMKIKKTGKKH